MALDARAARAADRERSLLLHRAIARPVLRFRPADVSEGPDRAIRLLESVRAALREPIDSPPRPVLSATARKAGATDATQAATWDRLRELVDLTVRAELECAQLLAGLVREQFAHDQAAQDEALAWSDRMFAPPRQSAAELHDQARVGVVDTAVIVFGGPRKTWAARADLGLAPHSIGSRIATAIQDRTVTVDQAVALVQDTDPDRHPQLAPELTEAARQALCDFVLDFAAQRSGVLGAPIGQGPFRGKLRREVVRRTSTPLRRRAALDERRAWTRPESDGTATFGVVGSDARCSAALRRVDAIARAVRAGGDARTLAQLRSDVALDLLLFGQPHPDAVTSVDHPVDGGGRPLR